MKAKYKEAYDVLKVMGVPVFVNEDHERRGNFGINAEDPRADEWVSYYHPPINWTFGVNPTLDAVLDQFKLFAEWQNPGCLGVWDYS